MPDSFAVYTVIRARVTFTDESGGLVDPTTVVFKYRRDSESEVTKTYPTDPEVVQESKGVYYIDILGDTSGHWYVGVLGTGVGQAGEDGMFLIKGTHFTWGV